MFAITWSVRSMPSLWPDRIFIWLGFAIVFNYFGVLCWTSKHLLLVYLFTFYFDYCYLFTFYIMGYSLDKKPNTLNHIWEGE